MASVGAELGPQPAVIEHELAQPVAATRFNQMMGQVTPRGYVR